MQLAFHKPTMFARQASIRTGCRCAVTRGSSAQARRNVGVRANFDLDSLGIDIPDIDADLNTVQQDVGAVLDERGVARTYGSGLKALKALDEGVAIIDRSHWGRIRIGGEGRLDFLHNQSTNDFKAMKPKQGCDTVFVNATARNLDLATALINDSNVMLIVSPEMKGALLQRFDKYIFPADKVEVQDVSDFCAMLSLIGPDADKVLKEIGGDVFTVLGQPYGTHQLLKFKTGPVIAVAGSGLASPGYTLIADESIAADLFSLLYSKGCVPMGEDEWERARILQGRPAAGAELAEDFNPMESGLYHAVSIDKGCYIGQETLAKLASLNGVKQQLWGVQLQGAVAPGSDVRDTEGNRMGRVTSYTTDLQDRPFALAFLKCKSRGSQVDLKGQKVKVGEVEGEVVPIPFASRVFNDALAPELMGPGYEIKLRQAQEKMRQEEEAKAVEAKAKAERLEAMKKRLEEWQAQQTAYQQKIAREQ